MERFQEKYSTGTEGECWVWKAYRNKHGYGQFYVDGRLEYAHRASWLLHRGEKLRTDEYICHTCDNPSCVNPSHLFKGSQKDNMVDMTRKKRLVVGNQKINERQVGVAKFLRESGVPVKDIASLYGIDRGHASRITRGMRSYYNKEKQ